MKEVLRGKFSHLVTGALNLTKASSTGEKEGRNAGSVPTALRVMIVITEIPRAVPCPTSTAERRGPGATVRVQRKKVKVNANGTTQESLREKAHVASQTCEAGSTTVMTTPTDTREERRPENGMKERIRRMQGPICTT